MRCMHERAGILVRDTREVAAELCSEHIPLVISDIQRDARRDSGVRQRQLARSRYLA